jgi:hypothetical protein
MLPTRIDEKQRDVFFDKPVGEKLLGSRLGGRESRESSSDDE